MRNLYRSVVNLLRTLARLREYIPFTRATAVLLAATVLLSTSLEVVSVGLLAQLLNLVLGTKSPGARPVTLALKFMPEASTVQLTVLFAVAVVVTMALKNMAAYGNTTLLARVERNGAIRLRAALFARLQAAPLDVFERHASASLVNLFVDESRRAMECLTVVTSTVQTVVTALLFFAALVWISPPLALATLVVGGLAGLLVAGLYRNFSRLGRDYSDANTAITRAASEAFNGVRVVRAAHAQDTMGERFGVANRSQAGVEERYRRASGQVVPAVETGSILAALVLLVGTYALLVEPGHMSQAKLTAFGLILLRMVPLVNRFFGTQAHLLYAAGGARAIVEWLGVGQYPVRPYGTETFTDLREGLEVRDLVYEYAPDQRAVDAVSFRVGVGETVALVGRSGSGKSTMASLFMRMRQPKAGTVLADGVDYWSFTPESWHAHVALVEQEPFLFNDTLGANVAFGCPGATREAVEFALHVAHLDDLLESLPDRLETPIGERGVMLSGGQRQRLSIARAIVRNPRLLILDEATSNLDTVSEQLVQAALEAAMRGRTTVVIAHRLSTVRRADRIVVLEHGRVAESGTWDELVAANGVFTGLVQSGFDADTDAPNA
ncbi:MAG TPA: ABC transporter ATP-binding protein [Gemmatimonadaceae bacterium]|nr:ABC transporter ATP-binding protein [Gemmatimonadaceae bacterium]